MSALVGTLMAVVFMGITAASILLANRFASSDVFVGVFFGIVLGGWLLKFVVFIVLVVVLRDAAVAEPDGAVPQPRRGRDRVARGRRRWSSRSPGCPTSSDVQLPEGTDRRLSSARIRLLVEVLLEY